tara:strand:- start:23030 stop:23824 length:795 start_codon:yes stop_codon:yes gene_type:complete
MPGPWPIDERIKCARSKRWRLENVATTTSTPGSGFMQDSQSLNRWGGVASLYNAMSYFAGMIYFLLFVDYTSARDPQDKLALLVAHYPGIIAMNLIIYVIFGIMLVFLVLSIHENLKDGANILRAGTVFGFLWAGVVISSGMILNVGAGVALEIHQQDASAAASFWHIISTIGDALGGGVEILGGLWMAFISVAGLRTRKFPASLHYLGLLVGVAGCLTIVPVAGEIGGAIFGLGQIPWFLWTGIYLLFGSRNPVDRQTQASSL